MNLFNSKNGKNQGESKMERPTLRETLSPKFKNGFRFIAWVNYGEKSGVSIQGYTLEELLIKAQREIERLKNDNPQLENFVIVCNTCFGSGQIEQGIYKNGYMKGRRKFKKCQDCKGIGRVKLE